jgi:hypothetical protein
MNQTIGDPKAFQISYHNLGMRRIILHQQDNYWFAIHKAFP